MGADEFQTAMQRLLTQVGHWETGRWGAAAGSGGGSRGDHVYALVQRLADHAADAGHHPRRVVPREPDMILPDQLRVMSDDLLAAEPAAELLSRAMSDITEVRTGL
ncbi:hypothetical protein [Actinoplanes sp. NPDC051494]|uniref:hypothetical protein n=1 Tax=Actinoplanes sp. NPDC051494 TaxID=3363907 RepID=UPI00379D95D6